MQALKTIADSAYHASTAAAAPKLQSASAWVSSGSTLYVGSDGRIQSLDLTSAADASELTLRERQQEFTEPPACVHALAVLARGTTLMARGCARAHEPTLSASLSFWSLRPGSRVVERVRDTPIASPHSGAIAAWAWAEQDAAFVVAVAFHDIHCTVQLYTFRRTELRPSKPSVQTLQASRDSNGEARVTNMHLLTVEGDPANLRLFLTLQQRSGPGRVESRSIDARPGGATVITLEAASVAAGGTAELAPHSVVAVTPGEQSGALASTLLAPLRWERSVVDACFSACVRRAQCS